MQDDDIARGRAELMRPLNDYGDRLKQLKELMEIAWARVMVALATREAMRELMAAAAAPERPNA